MVRLFFYTFMITCAVSCTTKQENVSLRRGADLAALPKSSVWCESTYDNPIRCAEPQGNCLCEVVVTPGVKSLNDFRESVDQGRRGVAEYFNGTKQAELFKYLSDPENSDLLAYLQGGPYIKLVTREDVTYALCSYNEQLLVDDNALEFTMVIREAN